MIPRTTSFLRASQRHQHVFPARAYSQAPKTREEIINTQIRYGHIPTEARPHPSAVQNPQLNQGKGGSNTPVLAILFGSLIALPPTIYFYWQHRDAHMKAKKEEMLQEVQARYKAG